MKQLWMILAGVGGALAVFFVFREDYEKAFVAAASGAVCWFLSYRQQVRARVRERDEEERIEDEESDEEVSS